MLSLIYKTPVPTSCIKRLKKNNHSVHQACIYWHLLQLEELLILLQHIWIHLMLQRTEALKLYQLGGVLACGRHRSNSSASCVSETFTSYGK